MVTREKLYTAEAFFEIAQLPENAERRLELEDGIIVEMPPSTPRNTVITGRIILFLNAYVVKHDLGYVTVPDGGFKLSSGRVRQPDVAFISKKRLPVLPERFEIAPDLAVEVVSPNEDVLKKVNEYIDSGTQLIWVIYPNEQIVNVFRTVEPRWQTLGINDILEGETVLPGFTMPIKSIFP
jgi:Uma2 family endonuclease